MTISQFSEQFRFPPQQDCLSKEKRPEQRAQLRQALLELLADASASGQPTACDRCGQPLQYLNATVALYGSDVAWQVRLPVCKQCMPQDQKLPRKRFRTPA